MCITQKKPHTPHAPVVKYQHVKYHSLFSAAQTQNWNQMEMDLCVIQYLRKILSNN